MSDWAGIALALRRPEDDGMGSRLPTYLHPLAGRSLAWHALRAMAVASPPPGKLLLVSPIDLDPAVVGELTADLVTAPRESWWEAVASRLPAGIRSLLFVDAAAATLAGSLDRLVAGPPGRVLVGPEGEPLAAWLDVEGAADRALSGASLDDLAYGLESIPAPADEATLVRDRAGLARAGRVIRDRIVARLLEAGVTFLLPETVLVDVDVQVGPDTVIYPGVILEGRTSIGAETVVGPGCRIIDSWIGSGVELKGWNYIVGSSIRNRAVLEPYVRRGFD
jgi:hypothetical protein